MIEGPRPVEPRLIDAGKRGGDVRAGSGLRHPVLVLTSALLVVGTVVAAVGYAVSGWVGVGSAALALAISLFSGLMALALSVWCRSPELVVYQVLLGMLPRMGIPLGACMIVMLQGGPLAQAGFVFYIMAFYFVTLALETFLVVGGLERSPAETELESG